MTKVTHVIEFVSGETTCASAPGEFCRFVSTRNFGTQFKCDLFNVLLFDHAEPPNKGWLARCPQCLDAFPNVRKPVSWI